MKIGKAKFGFTQKKYFKMKDGENTFRILPPLRELADDGVWSVFYRVHYGYKNTKGKLRVFQSSLVKNRKGMVEVPDAAIQRIDDLKAKLAEAKAAGNKAMVEKLGKLVSGQKPMYNVDANHYVNAIDAQGNIGILKLRHRAKQALQTQIDKLREKGIDPLSVDNGRYFVFTRTGSGLDTAYSVAVLQEKLVVQGVGEVNRDVIHKLSDELISRLDEESGHLDKLYRALSADDIARIVSTTDLMTGQSPVIDELFDAKGDDGNSDAAVDEDDEDSVVSGAATSTSQVASAPATVQQAAPVQQVAPAAVVTQTVVSTPAPAVTTKSAPLATTSELVAEMSDDDFLKSLNL